MSDEITVKMKNSFPPLRKLARSIVNGFLKNGPGPVTLKIFGQTVYVTSVTFESLPIEGQDDYPLGVEFTCSMHPPDFFPKMEVVTTEAEKP